MPEIQTGARGEDARFVFPRVVESTFATENFGTAANCLLGLGYFTGEAVADDVEITTDREVMNGEEFPTEQNYGRRKVSFSFDLPLTDVTLAWVLGRGFGTDTVSAGGSANDKIHTYARYGKNVGVPGFSMQYQTKKATADGTMDIRALGAQIMRARIEWNRAGWARIKCDCIGSGRKGTVAALTESSMVQSCLGPLWTPSAKIIVGLLECTTHRESILSSVAYTAPTAAGTFANMTVGGTLVQVTQELETGFIELFNDLDEARSNAAGNSVGAGVYGDQAPIGDSRDYFCGMQFIVPGAGTSTLLHTLLAHPGSGTSAANKAYAVRFEMVSDVLQASASSTNYRGWVHTIPIALVPGKPKPGMSRGLRTASVEFHALKDQSSSAYSEAYWYVSTPATTAYSATA